MSTSSTTAVTTKNARRTPSPEPLSPSMTIVWIFVTHGLVNGILLSPLNPVRCAYFADNGICSASAAAAAATTSRSTDGSSTNDDMLLLLMLNCWSLSLLHVNALLAALAISAVSNKLLEQRLLTITVAVLSSCLSAGVSLLPYLHKPMAALQAIIFVGLLLGTAYTVAVQHARTTCASSAWSTLTELRNAAFDSRRKLPLSTIILFLQFVLVSAVVLDLTFSTKLTSVVGLPPPPLPFNTLLSLSPTSSPAAAATAAVVGQAATISLLWVALILGASVVVAPARQQKTILLAHAFVLFLFMLLLASELSDPGDENDAFTTNSLQQASSSILKRNNKRSKIEMVPSEDNLPQLAAQYMIGAFVAMIVSLWGGY